MNTNPFAAAACTGFPPEWWFPDSRCTIEADRAINICRRCTVRQHCYETALATNELGIWGGVLFHPAKTRRLRKGTAA